MNKKSTNIQNQATKNEVEVVTVVLEVEFGRIQQKYSSNNNQISGFN